MDEDWVLYYVTTFTFSVIFFFCYVRHVFTFFERNRVERASHPRFPFGNIYDVVSQNTSMFMLLWKFYNKLKKKGCKVGGFYIFTEPAIIVLDSKQIETVFTTRRSSFQDLHRFCPDSLDHVGPELSEELLKAVLNGGDVWPKVLSYFPQDNYELDATNMMEQFLVITIEDLFKAKLPQKEQNFFSLTQIFLLVSYPRLSKVFPNKDPLFPTAFVEPFQTLSHFSLEEKLDFAQAVIYKLKVLSNLLLFALFELSVNEQIQNELRHEITKFQRAGGGTHDDLNKLPYLEAVLCETLRKYPFEPFVARRCKTEYSENGVHFAEGTPVFISIFGVHHDKRNFTDPEEFDPDRFFEENFKFVDDSKYMPFGCQENKSFGCVFVRLVVKTALVELLSRLKFSLSAKSPKSLEFDATCYEFLKLKNRMWLTINKL